MGQNSWASAQAIGEVLSESIRFNEDGVPMMTSIANSGVLTTDYLPDFEVKFYESVSKLPSGAKGIGESPSIVVPTALSRAIEKCTGIRIKETSLTDEVFMKIYGKSSKNLAEQGTSKSNSNLLIVQVAT